MVIVGRCNRDKGSESGHDLKPRSLKKTRALLSHTFAAERRDSRQEVAIVVAIRIIQQVSRPSTCTLHSCSPLHTVVVSCEWRIRNGLILFRLGSMFRKTNTHTQQTRDLSPASKKNTTKNENDDV